MPSRARTTPIIDTPEGRKLLRIHGTIARDIGIRIVSGRIQPDEVLNGEVEASDRLRVSRTAYSETVHILAAKGLVESRPKTGTRVSTQAKWNMLDHEERKRQRTNDRNKVSTRMHING